MLNGMRGSNSHWFPHLMGWSIYLHRNVIHCSNETSSIKVRTTMGSSCQNLFEASHCLFRTTLLKSPFHECMISNIIKKCRYTGGPPLTRVLLTWFLLTQVVKIPPSPKKIMLRGVYTNYVASWGGGGVHQMSTLHYNPYIVKVATKGGGGVKNFQKMAT